jgi:hypothetical protein
MNNGEHNFITAFLQSGMGYFWFLVLAIWGGTANYISRVRKDGMKFSTVELIGEWSVSGFVGIITALVCQAMEINMMMTYAMVGIAGHAGGRAIFVFETVFHERIKKWFDR